MALRSPAGDRRHVVVVEQKSTTKGSMGNVLESWSTFATIRCKIWPGKGKEAEESRRETGRVLTRFFTGYYPGITIGMRLSFKSRYFDITNIANLGELNRELEISTEEIV